LVRTMMRTANFSVLQFLLIFHPLYSYRDQRMLQFCLLLPTTTPVEQELSTCRWLCRLLCYSVIVVALGSRKQVQGPSPLRISLTRRVCFSLTTLHPECEYCKLQKCPSECYLCSQMSS
jgi:hypothetical protein